MNRLSRITAILIQLQSKRIITAKEIATRFEISLRTVYRDIRTLQDAGVPIGSENGVGYFMVEGYRLPPINLTEEEANALIISEQFIKHQGDTSLIKNYESLLIKIKAILRSFQKDRVQLLEARTDTFIKGEVVSSSYLSEVQLAITHMQQLSITYLSAYKDEVTSRNIEPMAIYFTNNAWVLIAYCHLRNDLREFRIDRITKLINLATPFVAGIEFNLNNYFESQQT